MKEKIPTMERGMTMEEFRSKISKFKEEEEERGISIYFAELDPDSLTEKDKEMYEAFLKTTPENLDVYIESFEKYRAGVDPDDNRRNFVEYLGNRITDIQLKKMLEKEKS